jgi:hypothetical protein
VAVHSQPGKPQDWAGKVTCYLSDDRGETWKRSETTQSAINPEGRRVNAQEPGVVELRDGRLMMFVRTNAGEQYRCYSSDRGTTWSSLEPMGVASPLSPATIERIPETNTLLMAWNDHSELPVERRKARTPFSLAVSDDEGQTWKTIGELDDDPKGWFCYTAMEFTDRHVLLAHVAGKQSPGKQLATTRITRVPLDQILPAANESSEPKLELVEVRKIWDKASHNAFTDLIRFKNRWYCVFREGENHVSPDGSLRVLTSQDGKQWESAALISSPDSDLRDAKITVTPDGRLMLSGAEAIHEPTTHRHQSLVWFSKHGTQWSDAVEVGDRDNWLWRVSWHDGKAYGFGYGCGPDNRGLRFYRSDDGRSFETLIDRVDVPGTYPNETSIVFAADDTAHCLLRQDGEPKSGFIGKAKPPYQDWTWQSLGVRIGGPEWIRLPNGKCLAAVRLYDDKVRTSLAWIDPETAEFTEALALPSGGDTSYAGMVLHGDEVWISYYSSHDRKNTSAKSAIYLARVKIDPVFETPGRKGTN